MERLAELLQAEGEMEFSAFVAAARQQGLRPDLWLRAKHAGLITAEIREGVHYVRAAGEPEGEG